MPDHGIAYAEPEAAPSRGGKAAHTRAGATGLLCLGTSPTSGEHDPTPSLTRAHSQ